MWLMYGGKIVDYKASLLLLPVSMVSEVETEKLNKEKEDYGCYFKLPDIWWKDQTSRIYKLIYDIQSDVLHLYMDTSSKKTE